MALAQDIQVDQSAAKSDQDSKRLSAWVLWFLFLILLSYGPTLYDLMQFSLENAAFAHVLFAPFVAGYMAWEKKQVLLEQKHEGSYLGLFLVFLGTALLCIGPPSLAIFVFAKRFALVLTVVGSIWFLLGLKSLGTLTYPLLVLVLMVPLPSFIYDNVTAPLQTLASRLSEVTFEMLGYSVLREGNILHLPGQTLSVVEACSGLRSLYALTFLTLTYAYFFGETRKVQYALIAAAIPVAIFANCARIVLTGVIGGYNKALTLGTYHDMLAWSVFVIGLLTLYLIHSGMRVAGAHR